MRKSLAVGLLVAAVFATYANTLANKFTSEDYYLILNNDFIPYWEHVGILFSRENFTSPFAIRAGARPLTLLSLMADFGIWKYRPFGYHLTNMVLHALNVLLLFFLLSVLKIPLIHALFTALLYALHPVQGEVVNVPGFRADLLAALFSLSALIFFITGLVRRKIFYFLPVFLFYVLALLSKEVSVVLPAVFIIYLLLFRRVSKGLGIFLCFFLFLGIFFLVYFWAERYSYDIFRVIFVNVKYPVRPFDSWITYFNTIFTAFWHYAKSLFFPVFLSHDYHFVISRVFSMPALFGVFSSIGLAAFFFATRDRLLRFFIGASVIFYFPVSNILPLFNTAADRYLYLPMTGFCYILMRCLIWFFERLETVLSRFLNTDSLSGLKYYFLVYFLLAFFGVSFNRNYFFKDMLTLYEQTVRESPENPRVCYNLAVAYRAEHRWRDSTKELEKMTALHPLYKRESVWQMLGENHQMMGHNAEAKKYYTRIIITNPNPQVLNSMAYILWKEGNDRGSLWLWEKVLEAYPNDLIALKGVSLIGKTRRK